MQALRRTAGAAWIEKSAQLPSLVAHAAIQLRLADMPIVAGDAATIPDAALNAADVVLSTLAAAFSWEWRKANPGGSSALTLLPGCVLHRTGLRAPRHARSASRSRRSSALLRDGVVARGAPRAAREFGDRAARLRLARGARLPRLHHRVAGDLQGGPPGDGGRAGRPRRRPRQVLRRAARRQDVRQSARHRLPQDFAEPAKWRLLRRPDRVGQDGGAAQRADQPGDELAGRQ